MFTLLIGMALCFGTGMSEFRTANLPSDSAIRLLLLLAAPNFYFPGLPFWPPSSPSFPSATHTQREREREKPPNHPHPPPPRLITTYSPHYASLRTHITQHWHIIQQDPILSTIFPSTPQVCYKKNPSLANKLIRASISSTTLPQHSSIEPLHITQPTQPQTPCPFPQCTTCPLLLHQTSITSPHTHRTFNTQQNITCLHTNVIYAIVCNICSSIYVCEQNSYPPERPSSATLKLFRRCHPKENGPCLNTTIKRTTTLKETTESSH